MKIQVFLSTVGLALLALALAGPAGAQYQGSSAGGGFSGPQGPLASAGQARKAADDTPIILEGNITRHLGGEHYEFKDASGIITVEIDSEIWAGQPVGPNDKVRLEGEVDRDFGGATEVDVKRLTRL